MQLTVFEVSKQLNVSVDTIRRWDKKGLIKSSRSENNYRLFNLQEVEALSKKLNGKTIKNSYKIFKNQKKSPYTVIELFAGCGGTSLGFENAGLNHVLLNEMNKDCVYTLKKNFPDSNVVHDDIRKIDFSCYKNTVDIVQAGFPCQAFSYAGKQLGFEDIRGTLFFEFARCVKEVMPKIAVAENVRGLLRHDNGRTLKVMIDVLREIGYKVNFKVLRAQYLDVPQKRERLIIVAIRKDLNFPFLFPKEKDYTISLRETLRRCPKSDGQKYSKKKADIMSKIPEGGYWRDLPIELQKKYMQTSFYLTGGRTGMARRLAWDEPSLTLTCNPAQKQTERCHPSETRPFTIREYARIQTFPDNWDFIGSISSQYKQIGNAVPVNLAFHIGNCLISMLSGKYDNQTMIKEAEELKKGWGEEQRGLFD